MRLPPSRGPISGRVVDVLSRDTTRAATLALGPETVLGNADAQLALWVLYELAYRGFDDVDDDREWDPDVLGLRRGLERRLEQELRAATTPYLTSGVSDSGGSGDIVEELERLVAGDDAPSVAAYLHRHATREEFVDYLRERSVQQLKESDPHSFVLPRLTGRAKVALAELQYDEYGAGRPERLHQLLYAQALGAVGLSAEYGAYVGDVGAASLTAANALSLFGLHRRLRGASMGYLAVFEATSSVPSRKVASGAERLGLPRQVAAYFEEHVEADAVHEQVALRDICGSLVEEDPAVRDDVLFGAACCLLLESAVGEDLLRRWEPVEVAS